MNTNTGKKLAGKVAVVTGASKGIGAAIAAHLAAEGAAVVVNYASSKTGADKVVAAITGAGGRAVAVQGDVSKKTDIDCPPAETKKAFWRASTFPSTTRAFTNSACPKPRDRGSIRTSSLTLNRSNCCLTTQEAVRHLARLLAAASSNISPWCEPPHPVANASVYSATKGAVDSITKSLAKELGPKKIRVNSLNPGMIETEGLHAAGFAESDFRKQLEATTPLGRIGWFDDTAKLSLCSSRRTIPGGSPAKHCSFQEEIIDS